MIAAVGDIHGQHTMLLALLEKLTPLLTEADTLVFLGDYVDRGEDSCAVIATLLELRQRFPNTVFLRGNHEQMMLDARDGPSPEPGSRSGALLFADATLLWLQNGGADTLLDYREQMTEESLLRWWETIPAAHWEFLRATEMERLTEHYHFVHAGLLPPGQTWPGEAREDAGRVLDPRLWIREPFLDSRADFDGRRVVFGHTPQMSGRPLVRRNKIGLDTAAVFGGPLTAALLPTEKQGKRLPPPRFLSVPHIRAETQ